MKLVHHVPIKNDYQLKKAILRRFMIQHLLKKEYHGIKTMKLELNVFVYKVI